MLVIPAIDLKGGRCVRLLQGRRDSETVFSDDPCAMAVRWETEGARLLHIVDLDGAFEKSPRNTETVKRILNGVAIPIQVGGGIRSMKTIAMYLGLGVARVILGTEAIRNPELVKKACKVYPDSIIVSLDASDGMVAVEGWTKITGRRVTEVAKDLEEYGVAGIIFTDIHKDGMQTGPNIVETRRLAESVSIPVIASGGVSNINDIKELLLLEPLGVAGVIIGRALYSGSLKLKDAIRIAEGFE
ncbi:MAG: 1-(5-phosphoribosyl)-5-[(5-phosphoribosylamino)methylideneamino]imidazole-4-carboxamide isomerase [Deltaproteobacteria bacterium]|nr:1-(5-phosphoribosyl)-5-[(5-phosphoribosylamino)methylideneamino]imidazole-4-carboxamide isomerase [Deltaproteobacteria bacterium]RLB90676.1 MAG: 1-(5-phosphoribosyl)-5-((5-phosphoribosylamino)methylideneamino)imidazole-4-carboxamide isomerase [Deltaproteobacteria bacterium]RLB95588.1 MAG: 1-(5-phosphoribosyl)-5-((5-phosphoribosylamino)methylideneamino)imidazole-4-carboxamide isomerase [Deltaproteobacteria bacterium]